MAEQRGWPIRVLANAVTYLKHLEKTVKLQPIDAMVGLVHRNRSAVCGLQSNPEVSGLGIIRQGEK